ncbi:MAG: transcription termination/antitermination protein NusG [Lachnospiraceae bacterium]|jgi:transcriptional antiterminator NusG|nr:transcription termination/antitermination protein NusG [Lachnospiraceae bacterium]
MADEAKWYVAHTYSGYENKVLEDIKQTVKNRNLQDQILDVQVPLESVIETKKGEERTVTRKLLPGYVLIKMVMNDSTWYVVRNTRGVTGFVGPGSKPEPLNEDELRNLGFSVPRYDIDIKVGDVVTVERGAWKGTTSAITNININKQTVTINVDSFGGREIPVELNFSDIEKI